MTNAEAVVLLEKLGACKEAVRWVRKNKIPPHKLWRTCKDSDWIQWLAWEVGVNRKWCKAAERADWYAKTDVASIIAIRKLIPYSRIMKAVALLQKKGKP